MEARRASTAISYTAGRNFVHILATPGGERV